MNKDVVIINSNISNTATLHPECRIENSSIGDESIIYKDAYVKESTFESNTFVGDGSFVEHSILRQYSRVQRNNSLSNASLDRHTYTGRNTTIMHAEIGKFSSISWNVTIGAPNHDYSLVTTHSFLYYEYDKLNLGEKAYNLFESPCTIGNDVWIGAGAVILRGVKVGDGSIIGANAIVTKDVPPYAIVVGNPATIIKYRFNHKHIERLLNIKWWDLDDEDIRKNIELFSSKMSESVLDKLDNIVGIKETL